MLMSNKQKKKGRKRGREEGRKKWRKKKRKKGKWYEIDKNNKIRNLVPRIERIEEAGLEYDDNIDDDNYNDNNTPFSH